MMYFIACSSSFTCMSANKTNSEPGNGQDDAGNPDHSPDISKDLLTRHAADRPPGREEGGPGRGRPRKGVRSRRGAAGRSEVGCAGFQRLEKVKVNRVAGQAWLAHDRGLYYKLAVIT